MTKYQRIFAVAWLLLLMAMLMIVPYSASYKLGQHHSVIADAGYGMVFNRPNGEACVEAVSNHIGTPRSLDKVRCMIYPDFKRLGLTLLAALAGGIAGFLLLGFAAKGRNPTREASRSDESPQPTQKAPGMAAALLAADPSLPISGGDLTEHSPLVITATRDHVGVEHSVIELLQSKEPEIYFKFKSQALLRNGRRLIDVQSYYYKARGAAVWEGTRDYYFDITEGFNALGGSPDDSSSKPQPSSTRPTRPKPPSPTPLI